MSDIYERITFDLDKITDEYIRLIAARTDELMDEKLASIGYAKVVRCKDCEHARIMRPLDWRTGKPSTVIEEWYCQWHSNAEGASDIEPDGFCAWGKRRESE